MVSEAQIVRLVRGRRYRPMTADEMAEELGVAAAAKKEFLQLIEGLKLAGELVEVKKKQLADPERVGLVVGTLLSNPRGFGFIRPVREKDGEDVYVRGSNMSSAVHGDIVVARAPRPGLRRADRRPRSGGRALQAEAKIISVLQRARTTVVGTFIKDGHVRFVVPDDSRLYRDVVIGAEDTNGARHGDKVNVRIATWPSRHINPTGEVIAVFGPRGQLDAERLAVVHEYNLRHEFPGKALRAADRLLGGFRPSGAKGRADLTGRQIITIDPEDARDFDDAVSLCRLSDGGWELGVHIADVSHYVKTGGAIDEEARARGTSVYLPGQVIPMLPEALANNICSLRPKEVRLTKTVHICFDPRGRLLKADVFNSVIKSCRRFNYKEVQAVIEGGGLPLREDALRRKLLEMHELAGLLRDRRREAGMLELDIPEARIIADEEGHTIGVDLRRGDDSHRLIEQFMLAANEAVAGYLLRKKLPYLCRAHDEPDPDSIKEFRESVRALGYNLPAAGTKAQIQRFLERVEGKPEAPILHFLLLRSMCMAEYSADDRPHYAIGAAHYLHFTSPIRRYPDLLAHRILDEYWSGEMRRGKRRAYWRANLPEWMDQATQAERNAQGAERIITIRRLKAYVAEQTGPMDALILRADNYGLRVQLCDSLVEGVVRMSALTDGYYRVDRTRNALMGPGKRAYRVGDTIRVRVLNFDELKHQIEFAPVL